MNSSRATASFPWVIRNIPLGLRRENPIWPLPLSFPRVCLQFWWRRKWRRKSSSDFLSHFLTNRGQRKQQCTTPWVVFARKWHWAEMQFSKLIIAAILELTFRQCKILAGAPGLISITSGARAVTAGTLGRADKGLTRWRWLRAPDVRASV